jgi:hypothetical protein
VLALGPDSVLAAAPGCSADGCRLHRVRVVTVTRDDVLDREVAPPPDRVFTGTPLAGGSVSNLLVVGGAGGRPALARVVAGGAATLLVRGSSGVDPAAGLVDDLDGTAYLVVRADDGSDGVVRAWAPGRPALARSARAPAVPPGAVLVCGCG